MHAGMLQVANDETGKNEKMSKSLNNFVLLYEALEQVKPNVLRMLVLQTHYRSPLVFGEKRLSEAESALSRVENFVNNLNWEISNNDGGADSLETDVKEKFIEAMDDDFNTSKALGHIFEFITAINSNKNLSVEAKTQARDLVLELIGVFGISFSDDSSSSNKEEILNKVASDLGIEISTNAEEEILSVRADARKEKN